MMIKGELHREFEEDLSVFSHKKTLLNAAAWCGYIAAHSQTWYYKGDTPGWGKMWMDEEKRQLCLLSTGACSSMTSIICSLHDVFPVCLNSPVFQHVSFVRIHFMNNLLFYSVLVSWYHSSMTLVPFNVANLPISIAKALWPAHMGLSSVLMNALWRLRPSDDRVRYPSESYARTKFLE